MDTTLLDSLEVTDHFKLVPGICNVVQRLHASKKGLWQQHQSEEPPQHQLETTRSDVSPTTLSSKALRIRGKASEAVRSVSRWWLQLLPEPIHHERPPQLRAYPCHYVLSVFSDGTPRAFQCKHSAYATCQTPDPSENHSTVASS